MGLPCLSHSMNFRLSPGYGKNMFPATRLSIVHGLNTEAVVGLAVVMGGLVAGAAVTGWKFE
ncbi:hypothetical protein DPMN_016274 [Dreissena polymorpha]|uniref:Uncharacterized protein n=1 Tax=Dreissena polymorpha TaxID=45954 RepID=A0A9D4N9D6_DREPO|nr:hypothetical protein DPMN_016274 [Dreissena polymorpha]